MTAAQQPLSNGPLDTAQPSASSVPTPAFASALTGACACCGAPTRSLFAMGHDARFRGIVARSLARSGWDSATVAWFDSPTRSAPLSPRAALAAVASLLDRDWTEKVERAASRTVRSSARPRTGTESPQEPVSADVRDFAAERIDALMARLDGVPLTGQWGWYRPSDDRHNRRSARVHATHRKDESSLVDLLVVDPDGTRSVVTGVEPTRWHHDEDARV